MSRVTVIIPSRNEPLLRRTVEDLLAKATGDIEIIPILEGYWPDPPLPEDPRVKYIHWGEVKGLRPSINAAASIATGDYLMKIDAHCAICEGYDEILQKDCEPDWIVVPSKYSLEPTTWVRFKPPWQYFFLTFPYDQSLEYIGLHDKNLGPSFNHERRDKPIDDIISYQGSCWFLSKKFFERIGPMDHEHYYYAQEPQELGLKAWLSGGRVVINKNAWYAHLHKGRAHGRGFPRYKGPWNRAIQWSANYWMTNSWPDRKYDMAWLVEKFWTELHNAPVYAWPDDWQDPKYKAYWDAKGVQ
jgi:glycosyltransferase involved in cell wall biosynthesis